jgi:hypothetical protein
MHILFVGDTAVVERVPTFGVFAFSAPRVQSPIS